MNIEIAQARVLAMHRLAVSTWEFSAAVRGLLGAPAKEKPLAIKLMEDSIIELEAGHVSLERLEQIIDEVGAAMEADIEAAQAPKKFESGGIVAKTFSEN